MLSYWIDIERKIIIPLLGEKTPLVIIKMCPYYLRALNLPSQFANKSISLKFNPL